MAFLRNRWALAALALLCWAVIATFATGYSYYLYTNLLEKLKAVPVHVPVSIDYGNGTATTFEDVYLFCNATALDALRAVASVTTEYYVGVGSLVIGVNGVFNDWGGAGVGWQYWINEEWGTTAPEMQILISGDQVEWKYTTYQGPS